VSFVSLQQPPRRVANDICRHFQIQPQDHHQLTFYRANLDLVITPIATHDRREYILKQIQKSPTQPTIIYTTLQYGAESLASFLKSKGLSVRPYHAGLRSEARSEIQEAFMSGQVPIICATIAFGMGIDKSDIRAIYHYNLPKSLENYTQEIGRAGRDGQHAHCELLACQDDLRTLANFTYGDTPQPDSLRSILRILLEQPGEFDISTYEPFAISRHSPTRHQHLVNLPRIRRVSQSHFAFLLYLQDLVHPGSRAPFKRLRSKSSVFSSQTFRGR
jgi:ATP-dependent DNA helicase RecQ